MRLFECLTDIFASGVTPDQCIIVWLAISIPANDGLSLIRHSDSLDLIRLKLGIFQFDPFDCAVDAQIHIFDNF